MDTPPSQYGLIRRVLLPFNGEEPLTRPQSLRVILVWALIFTAPMLVCTLAFTLAASTPLNRMITLLLIVLLSGVVVFGLTAWVVVNVLNRSARLFQRQKATDPNSTSGGRYGS